jgi:putative hydrolase of the HAD superfamily
MITDMNDLPRVIESKRAVLFDLFHTLTALESTWSSGPLTHQLLGVSKEAWNEQLQEKSRPRLAGQMKDPMIIIRTMAHAIDSNISEVTIAAAVRNRMERFAGALINVPQETLGVLHILRNRGKRLGLIGNADVMEIAAWDRSPMAPLFDAVVFSCHVGCVKPEREIYEACMAELQVSPYQCVFVGDGGMRELEGARQLGIVTVMITGIIKEIWPDKIEERKKHADFIIEELGEIVIEGT